jgi:hypothetical protein
MPMAAAAAPQGAAAVQSDSRTDSPHQLTGVNQAHEKIAHSGTVDRFIEERIPAVESRFLQGSFDDIVIQRGSWLQKKKGQLFPVFQ